MSKPISMPAGGTADEQRIQPRRAAAGSLRRCLRHVIRAGLALACSAALSAAAASEGAFSETAPKKDGKKHSVSFSGSFDEDFLMERVMVFSAALKLSYKLTKALSLSAESGYRHPLRLGWRPHQPHLLRMDQSGAFRRPVHRGHERLVWL